MAGIEQLEIHSKSYIVRWAHVGEGQTISWSVQPHKKSINFGIVKHPGTGGTKLTTFQSDLDDSPAEGGGGGGGGGGSSSSPGPESKPGGVGALGGVVGSALFAKKDASTAPEQLRNKGFKLVDWHGKCDADKVAMGTYDVQPGDGGMYGLVFDNTFSKQTSKTATFVLLTHPTGAPPQGARNLPNLQAGPAASASRSSLGLGRNNSSSSHAKSTAAAAAAAVNKASSSPRLGALPADSVDSLTSHLAANGAAGAAAVGAGSGGAASSSLDAGAAGSSLRPGTPAAASSTTGGSSAAAANCHVGTLLKRRRKKGQGYARRFFSLDYATCTLSYYHNRSSSALRGAIPLSLAAIAADERRREITIDSGAEVWHLKASNTKEFTEWARALERATRIARGLDPNHPHPRPHRPHDLLVAAPAAGSAAAVAPTALRQEENREWQQVEALVSRVVGTRDALRRLVKDMAAAGPHPFPPPAGHHQPTPPPPSVSEESDDYLSAAAAATGGPPAASDRRPFWRRKSSAASPLAPQNFRPSVASSLAVPAPSSAGAAAAGAHGRKRHDERSMEDHCQALLGDLESVVTEFTKLLANSKHRRTASAAAAGSTSGDADAGAAAAAAGPSQAAPRTSYDSTSTTDEFFDAAEGAVLAADRSQLLRIDNRSEAEDTPGSEMEEPFPAGDGEADGEVDGDGDDSSVSETEADYEAAGAGAGAAAAGEASLFPTKPKSLTPLPLAGAVRRRTTIPPATVLPPSLIAFVRKNVGKDLSTISMPASANEPTSLLQRMAEQLEYAHLLNTAAALPRAEDRLLTVAAFAVSQFAGGRAKERAIRKPFNPLLGETFELLRTDAELAPPGSGGMRLLVEKVSHRPVRLAIQADAAAWTFAQAAAPSQKFWGKSAEIITEGRVRVVLRLGGGEGGEKEEEHYSWALATVFLRNVVMGEKYVEPVGTMTVVNDTTGQRAVVEFRSKGMFGGRSEDVQVEAYDAAGAALGASLTGTWTAGLRAAGRTGLAGTEVWHVGALVADAARVYGLTQFAASLNEVTALERGRLAPTDCRLRPDQRLAEEGRLDEAEVWKTRLEEAQRRRRRQLEERGEAHRPRWFVPVATGGADGDEVWRLKTGKDGYWEERARGAWSGVEDLFGGGE